MAGVEHLFTGAGLDGWKHVGPGGFDFRDGSLFTRGGMGLLWYSRRVVGDEIVRVVYRVGREEDNSGVFVRIDGPPADPWHAVHHGYEVQIFAPADDRHATGCVYSMSSALSRPQRPPGLWNEMAIELDGERIRVHLNDEVVTEFDADGDVPPRERDYEPERGPRPTHGYVGLQNHDGPSVVEFAEVSTAPLR